MPKTVSMSCFKEQKPRLALSLLLLAALAGCTGGPGMSMRGQSEEPAFLAGEGNASSGIAGPTERNLNSLSWKRRQEELRSNPESAISADFERYEQAVAVYENGEYAAAEKLFKKLIRDRRKTYESPGARWRRWWGMEGSDRYDPFSSNGDPIEEDALFMIAETQFALEDFTDAQDSYDDLLNRYPSTRHLDQTTQQLFRIARYWLDFPEDINSEGEAEIQLAGNEELTGKSVKFADHSSTLKQIAIIPNLTDRTRPTFDTYGRGLQALRSIWLHDPTGPLADDALMLSANHHLRSKNYEDAARDYRLLRENYPDSPHYKDAYVLGSHVTFASYQGSAYDNRALEEAKELKQAALQMFPDISPEQRQRLQEELQVLQVAEEARIWDRVEFYEAKGVPESMALYCNMLINRHPDSPFADKARLKLNELAADRARASQSGSWNPLAQPRTPSPSEVRQPIVRDREPVDSRDQLSLPSDRGRQAAQPEESKPGVWQRLGGFLKRADEPPNLQTPPGSDEPAAKVTL
ncbi:MAG: tetratricopeptide repeat protein [Planctomycetaceae bacterium]|nr:tetratricopeptide repeat protein [Planctomycetaceae bacterium]MCB9952954.1 tetratricopeptide repeat protein [Planctomycetaceae bacterium]